MLRWFFAPALRRGRAFGRDEHGVTAIEFAILGLPFFTLIFAIVETAVVFLASQILDSAVQDAARMIRTGRAQSANYEMSNFRTLVCGGLYELFDCDELRLKVQVVASFTDADTEPAVESGADCDDGDCAWTVAESYVDGVGSDVILVEAYYKWPTVVNLPGFNLQNQGDGTRLIAAVRVFRNEPF